MWSKRMKKKHINLLMSEEMTNVLDNIAKRNGTSRSKAMDLCVKLVDTYFEDNQVDIEFDTIKDDLDGRKNNL